MDRTKVEARRRAEPGLRPNNGRKERAPTPVQVKHEGARAYSSEFVGANYLMDDLSLLNYGEGTSQATGLAISRDQTPSSDCSVISDYESQRQMELLFQSILNSVPAVGRNACACCCHVVHGYDIDMSCMEITDICLHCECYERW